MDAHEFLTVYQAKAVEYLLAVAYLALFLPFWRFVSGRSPLAATAPVRREGWFHLPDGFLLDKGHAWARREGTLVAVGMDDFAGRLLGAPDALELPQLGARVRAGEPAIGLKLDGHTLSLQAPLDGVVVAANRAVLDQPALASSDPYGRGWLVKLRPTNLREDLVRLASGDAARNWLDRLADGLRERLTPLPALALQDGGRPVPGLARAIDPEHWVEIATEYLEG
ncbi:MAG: glycine cleavage system protein H [Vicinamibacteria bacterium]